MLVQRAHMASVISGNYNIMLNFQLCLTACCPANEWNWCFRKLIRSQSKCAKISAGLVVLMPPIQLNTELNILLPQPNTQARSSNPMYLHQGKRWTVVAPISPLFECNAWADRKWMSNNSNSDRALWYFKILKKHHNEKYEECGCYKS
jgi:hypothetical protein